MDSGGIDDISVVRLANEDLTDCMQLSTEAGWNQTIEDWQFHLQVGDSLALRSTQGGLVATGVTLPAAADVGWIAMVLVDQRWRRRGLGRRVMETLVARSSFPHLALDATELGRGLYHSLGFRPLEAIVRYRLSRGDHQTLDLESIQTSETTFSHGIAELLADRPDVSRVGSRSAHALIRPGRVALHLGPMIAARESDAEALVKSLVKDSIGDVFIDVPSRAGTFCRRLERLGFQAERAFTRMSRGRAYLALPGTFATAGPEYG